ncbi:MAG: hypothetical protein M3P11_10905 [Actinomycetota bacterium]|nr:hypothetical protein [Actinomycetota bacterium]
MVISRVGAPRSGTTGEEHSPSFHSRKRLVSSCPTIRVYDHVVPPTVNGQGLGIRVPGLVISPYARKGFVDHQQLSTDSYLKFIEDDFLNGQRLDPNSDGRPDSRPFVAEDQTGIGDLVKDFDFAQKPRPTMILSTTPLPGPASLPNT